MSLHKSRLLVGNKMRPDGRPTPVPQPAPAHDQGSPPENHPLNAGIEAERADSGHALGWRNQPHPRQSQTSREKVNPTARHITSSEREEINIDMIAAWSC